MEEEKTALKAQLEEEKKAENPHLSQEDMLRVKKKASDLKEIFTSGLGQMMKNQNNPDENKGQGGGRKHHKKSKKNRKKSKKNRKKSKKNRKKSKKNRKKSKNNRKKSKRRR